MTDKEKLVKLMMTIAAALTAIDGESDDDAHSIYLDACEDLRILSESDLTERESD